MAYLGNNWNIWICVWVASFMSVLVASIHGQPDQERTPGILCTVQPALLPPGLTSTTVDTTNAALSKTEIRAYVTSSLASNDYNITFNREFYTGTEHSLPEGTDIIRTDYGAKITLLNYKNTTGIYSCGLESTLGVFSTSVILHTRDSDPRLRRPTFTVNIGETAELRVLRNNLMGIRWIRTDNGRNLIEGNNQDRLVIGDVTISNSTVYEAMAWGERMNPHSIVRLIVRECPAGFWDPINGCTKRCPKCNNGGVCSDKTGRCICAPGFAGNNCENLHGRNSFGQNGEFNCTNGEPASSPGCRGIIFCLQDPYGCSCGAGYYGTDCMDECPPGRFGAGCELECHCTDNQLCAKDTGSCDQCDVGYAGGNCQEKLKVTIDTTFAKGYNVGGGRAPISCRSFLSSRESDLLLVSDSGVDFIARRFNPIEGVRIGLEAEFYVDLGSSRQEFTCVAKSTADEGNITAVVRAYVPPQLRNPPDVSLKPSSPTTIMVSWTSWTNGTDNGDGPITKYLVQYRETDTGAEFVTYFTISVGHSSTNSVNIPLSRETTYDIVVVSVRPGSGGSGAPSPIATITTGCVVPSGTPTVLGTERMKNAFSVTWQLPAPETWGCSQIITRIRYQSTSSDVPSRGDVDVPAEDGSLTQNHTVAGLPPCIEYSLQLMLVRPSDGGFGPRSPLSVVDVGGDAPGPVTDVEVDVKSTRFKLTWQPPKTGCDIIKYTINHKLINYDQCNDTMLSETVARTKRKLKIGLGNNPAKEVILPHSTYNVSVLGMSLDGIGEEHVFQVTTLGTNPSAPPSNVTVSVVGADKLIFTWDHVVCGSRHGYINSYSSKLTDQDGGKIVTRNIGEHIRTVPYINLSSCTNYTFEIRANIGDQIGVYSDPLVVSTPIGIPDIVQELRAYSPRSNIIYVSWSKPNHTRCAVTYHVEYSLSMTDRCLRTLGENVIYAAQTTETHFLLEGLEPFSTYTIYITAASYAGNGTKAAVIAETKEAAPGTITNIMVLNTTSDSASFAWEEPACGNKHGEILGYHYILRLENVVVSQGSTTDWETEITFYDLEGCTSYDFEVFAWNQKGNGTDKSVTAVTGVSVPNPISELFVDPQGTEAMRISWRPPTNTRCPIDNYIIIYSLLVRDQCEELEQGEDVDIRELVTTDLIYTLMDLEAYSTYSISVMAETEAGVGDALTLNRNTTYDVPGLVNEIILTNQTSTSLTFSWSPPPCGHRRGPITSYEYLASSPDGSLMLENVVSAPQVTLMNLKPCGTYNIRVKARNDHNVGGGYGLKVNGTTGVAKPGKVTNINIDTQSTSAHITWSPPHNFTCDVTAYSIFYGLRNPGKCRQIDMEFVKAGDTDETEFILSDLLPNSVYRVYIVAGTSAGHGQSTLEMFTTTEGVPGKPQKVSVSENLPSVLTFSWRPLHCAASNGVILGYNYVILQGDDEVTNQNVSADTRTVSLTNDELKPCANYIIRVRAFTVKGFGEFTSDFSVKTVSTVPPAVENPIVFKDEVDATKLFVSWSVPQAETCDIQDFLVMYGIESLDNCKDEGAEFLMSTMSIILTNGTDIVLDELHPNTLYNITITARTAAGQGENVSVIYRTPEAPPMSPPRVYFEPPLREETLFFSWDPLPCDEQNGAMTGYNATLEGEDYVMTFGLGISSTYTQFDKLLPCTEYKFRISAINKAGVGPYSVPIAATTLPVPPNKVATVEATSAPNFPNVLNITWDMPSNQICPIDNYTITTSLIRRLQCSSVLELQEERAIVAGNEDHFSQMSLFPASLYNITVFAATAAGYGNAQSAVAATSAGAPSASPANVIIRHQLQHELVFTWDAPPCRDRNGEIVGYQYTLRDASNRTLYGSTFSKELTIPGLIPFTSYVFQVGAETKAGLGPKSVAVRGKTKEAVPPMPRLLEAVSKTDTSLQVQWLKPSPSHGVITGYRLAYWPTDENGVNNKTATIDGPNIGPFPIVRHIAGLKPYTKYSIQVQAQSRVGYGAWTHPYIIARTDEGIPSAPVSLFVDERSHTRLRVGWKEPDLLNGKILQYNIKYKAIEKPFDPSFVPSDDKTVATKSQYKILDNLDPATKYEIRVSAATSAGSGSYISIEEFTRPPSPKAPVKPQQLPSDSDDKVYLQLVPVDGDFNAYHVSVKRKPGLTVYKRAINYQGNYQDNSDSYIAAEFNKNGLPGNFTVGDNKTYEGFYNPPLAPDFDYSISLCTVSRTTKDTESSCSEPVQVSPKTEKLRQTPSPEIPYEIIGIAAAILVALAIVFIILAAVRRKRVSRSVRVTEQVGMSKISVQSVHATYTRKLSEDDKDVEKTKPNVYERGSPIKRSTGAIRNKPRLMTKPTTPNKGWRPPTPISIPNLPKYIRQRKADGDKGFTRDYESMPAGQTYPWDIAKIPENKPKNRYANIIAYNHSRVILEPYDDVPYSDYINANYVDGCKTPSKYIASQGPNQASTVDFWRMIWQERVPKVIMLTNIVENGKKKCEKYWPNKVQRYGELLVNMAEEKVCDYYTERTFNMEDDYIGEQREVKQFHFTAWPDMGLPDSPTPLLSFVQRTKEYHIDAMQNGPTVVHCSAGVGRTGTFLAIDAMLDMAVQTKKVNILDFVYRMRQQRIKMVQTQDQYMFIFEVLLEALLCGDTVFSADHFSDRYSDLKQPNPFTEKPYIEEQLRALDVMSIMPNENNARGGRMPDNVDKNRYQHLIPIDIYRPYLMTPWKERTNYINATFLDAFRHKDGFLATQMPLQNTVIDFWRMVYDYRSNVIVMLNRMDLDDSSCAQYWPDGGSLEYGPYDVELMSAEECGETIVRTLKLKHAQNRDTRIIHQYQYLGWPERETFPASPSSLLALTELVVRGQRTAGDGPTTVHCMDGVSRCGLFSAILIALSKLRLEGNVDVFHAVKKLRKARAGMVASLEHYVYCYNTMLTYLESNQVYENY